MNVSKTFERVSNHDVGRVRGSFADGKRSFRTKGSTRRDWSAFGLANGDARG